MEIKKTYKNPHEEELTTKTHSFTKNYIDVTMSDEIIIIRTVAEHILEEECRKCASYSRYQECDKKSECLKGWEKEIRSWKDE